MRKWAGVYSESEVEGKQREEKGRRLANGIDLPHHFPVASIDKVVSCPPIHTKSFSAFSPAQLFLTQSTASLTPGGICAHKKGFTSVM